MHVIHQRPWSGASDENPNMSEFRDFKRQHGVNGKAKMTLGDGLDYELGISGLLSQRA